MTAGGWERASTRCRVLQYLSHLDGAWDVEHRALDSSSWSRRLGAVAEHPARTRGQRALRRMRYHFLRLGEGRANAAEWAALGRAARGHDLVFLQKVVPPPAVLRSLAASGAALVFDFDDVLVAPEGSRASRSERRFQARLEACLLQCDLVLTCSDYNREFAARWARRVEVIPTPVDVERYRPRVWPGGRPELRSDGSDLSVRSRASGAAVTIGWIGSPSTTPYLRSALPVFGEVARLRPGIRFLFLGAEPFPVAGLPVAFERWEYARELEHLARFDIGIMPLRPSTHALGKAGYKLLQYMALGLPSVASPEGVNAEIVADGVTGFLEADAAAWRDRLLTLVDDAELRARMGAAARRSVEREYSVEAHLPRWRALLEAAMERGRARVKGGVLR